MKIFSICCVRDENDIIQETLEAALTWSDKIFVFDNASTDGSWETLNKLARQRTEIVIAGHDNRRFSEELRGEIFESYRKVASPGDWWCRLDADEIYIDNPSHFLAQIPAKYGFVYSATHNFYLTDIDVENYERDPSLWLSRPMQERLKYYQNNWSEPRFVRYDDNLLWGGSHWPPNRGQTFHGRIRLKHFQYRSPEQIARRLGIRQKQLEIFPHEVNRTLCVPEISSSDWSNQWLRTAAFETASWRDRIRPAAECDLDQDDGTFIRHDELMPALPSPRLDLIRTCLQSTSIGRASLRPILKWREKRRLKKLKSL